jgi:NADH-quinone oxidoreductase subunit L
MMMIVITTVSFMVNLYSLGYMKGEKGFQRYYAFLSLFAFSMLGLVMATNIFQMYIFWELVGCFFLFADRILLHSSGSSGSS